MRAQQLPLKCEVLNQGNKTNEIRDFEWEDESNKQHDVSNCR